MRKTVFLTVTLLVSIVANVWAEVNDSDETKVRYIKSPRFAKLLVEKWIADYSALEGSVKFAIASSSASGRTPELSIVVAENSAEGTENGNTVYFGQYAVLPITARNSEASRVLDGKKLNGKKLKELFFVGDEIDDEVKKNKQFERLTIYSGSNATSVASAFASNLGELNSNFRGKRIAGDDLFLNTAVSKDPLGVTFNTLPNIYDIQSRRVKADLSIVSLEVKKSQGGELTDETTLDDVIIALENGRLEQVAVEKVGFSYDGADEDVTRFLQWVLASGTKLNHEYGILNLDNKVAAAQALKLEKTLASQK